MVCTREPWGVRIVFIELIFIKLPRLIYKHLMTCFKITATILEVRQEKTNLPLYVK